MTRRRYLSLIFLVALALRLVPVLLSYNLPIGLDDMFQYDMLARSIVSGNGFRWYAEEDLARIQQYVAMEPPPTYDPRGVLTSFRAPGYPVFLALIYALCGVGEHRFFYARLVQALLGASLAPLSWALAQTLGVSERAARWTAVFSAVFPLLIIYPLALVTENLFIPLLALAFWLVLRANERGRVRDYVLAGIVLGATALTRSIIAGFLPLAALWLWFSSREKRLAWRNIAVLFLCFLLLTVPWAIRNTLLHGQPTWIETSLGYNMYLGYHPQGTGTFQFGISLDLLTILDDGERHAKGMAAFREFVRANPARVPYLMVRKLGYLWGLDKRELIYFYANGFFGQWPTWVLILVCLLACGPLILLTLPASCGLACGRMGRHKFLVLLLLVYYVGVHMLIMAASRFHVPLLPFIAVLAAYALVDRPWRESRRWQRSVAILLIALLLANWAFEIVRDWPLLSKLFGPEGHHLHIPY